MTTLHVPDVTGMDTLHAALAYAEAGWFVAPVRAGTKNPGSVLGRAWEQKTSRDAKEIASWYAGTDHGIALHAGRSGAVVLDIDDPVPSPELDALLALITEAPTQRTDKAGVRRHALVRMPEGRTVGNASRGLKVGAATIDVRGLNGVIIVAPTFHVKPDGEYAWIRTGPVPACPPALAEQLLDTKPAPGAVAEGVALDFWRALPDPGITCSHMARLENRFIERLAERGAGYRHETAKEGMRAIVGAGSDGHHGAVLAADRIRAALRAAAGAERDTEHEATELIRWAIACALEERSAPLTLDPCGAPLPEMPHPVSADGTPWPVTPPALSVHALPALPDPASDGLTLDAFVSELLTTPEEKRAARSRDRVAEIFLWPEADLQPWRDAMKKYGDLDKGDFGKIVASLKRDRKAQETAAREAARLAEIQGRGGELMPGPHAPLDAAEFLRARIDHTDGAPHRRWWRGDFYRWNGAHWQQWRDDAVDNWLYSNTRLMAYEDEEGNVADWNPGPRRIEGVAHALGRSVLWRDSDAEADDSPDAIACANGVVTASGLAPHHPARFNLHSLPFPYDPAAACPEWLGFLDSVLPGDSQAQQFLAEWFGYVISGRTDLQKMASLFGPPRCGKGTIARILEALLGPESVASPTLDKLATQFGEAPLIGKRLAVLSDVRWNARATAEAVPILLAISGEDARNVPRKNRDDWHGKLPVRFMTMGNDAPTFSDASGALAGRMVHVEFRTSFLGREDHALTGRLLTELPGILNWALRGLAALTTRGRFQPPASSDEAQELVARMSSPVGAFIADRCELAGEIPLDDLYNSFRKWCDDEGRQRGTTKDIFSRDLRTTTGGTVTSRQVRIGAARIRMVSGIRLVPSAVTGVSGQEPWLGSVTGPVTGPFVP